MFYLILSTNHLCIGFLYILYGLIGGSFGYGLSLILIFYIIILHNFYIPWTVIDIGIDIGIGISISLCFFYFVHLVLLVLFYIISIIKCFCFFIFYFIIFLIKGNIGININIACFIN